MNDAPILLCDEPTGSLDAAAGAQVLDLLEEVASDRGATLIVVTHEPAVAERADRRITLLDGRVAEDDERGSQ
jgi:ABC-type lipoprotein export system ATPase subunit